MAEATERILLVGVPRSGTTVVANYVNSLEHGFCFLEPHWEYARAGSTKFFRDPKLRRFFFLRYRADDPLPIDGAIRRIQQRYALVGFKETFRGDHYGSYDPAVPNESLLSAYVNAGYRLIPILRDPVDVWNSWLGFFVPQDVWPLDFQAFIENFRRFLSFAAAADPMIYESFIQDPPGEMARIGIRIDGFQGRLKRRRSRMGDPEAMRSTEVTTQDRPVRISEEDRQALLQSDVVGAYQAAVGRARS